MRAFITGISGFVGGHLAAHLRASGDAVLGASRNRATVAAETLMWDVAAGPPSDAVRDRIETFAPEVLFHLAAVSVPRDCGIDEPTPEAVRTNIDGTRHVLDLARSLSRPPRVVFLSTSHVYAPTPPQQPFVTESQPLEPRNAYGQTKLAAEELCRAAQAADHLDVVIVRSFTQSGPGQDVRLMLAEWAEQFVRGGDGPIEVISLDVLIDLLDVRDAVRALRAIALRGESGGVYNLGSGVPRTTGEVFELLRSQTGDRRSVRELRPGRRQDPIADVTRLQTATGWTPQIPPEQTVADVLADRRRNASS